MQNWTIGKRLIVGFSVVLVITVTLGVFAFVQLTGIRRQATAITGDALPGVYEICQAQSLAKDNRGLLLQHIVSDDPQQMADAEREMAATGQQLDAVLKTYESTISRAKDRELFNAIGPALAEMRRIRDAEIFPLSRAAKQREAADAFRTKFMPAFKTLMNAANAEVEFNKTSGDQFSADIMSSVGFANLGIIIGIVVAGLLGSGIAFVIIRTTNGVLSTSVTELSEGAEQVVSASTQVSTAAQSLSQGSTEQAASLEETSASMEEMASMTRQNAENAGRAAELMTETTQVVDGANHALDEMVASMGKITESSDKVSRIIKTIDEIAFQTNILALNAAVEAARAGEAGMGFAVVADEVRNLAQRSAQAAKDTAVLIEESIENARQGSTRLQQVSTSITAITDSANKVKSLVDEISVAGRQQAQGIDQVSQAIAQMEKVTQTTAATAEESAAASEELNAQAESSMGVVRRLELLVGGRTDSAAHRKPARTARTSTAAPASPATSTKVVKMGRPTAAADPETVLPMKDTGTFGKF
jgi:methyl-accepting chemotaxis protein